MAAILEATAPKKRVNAIKKSAKKVLEVIINLLKGKEANFKNYKYFTIFYNILKYSE
ncbi:MAG: hypothetical protein ACE5KE_07095 [Methanosarcinales archaeon]